MDLKLFGSTFALIFMAELPDKTAFASLVLATRHNPFAVFLGASGAFVIQSLVAVAFGSLVGLLPPIVIHRTAGLLFLLFAGMMWFRRDDEPDSAAAEACGTRVSFLRSAMTAFLAIFIAEWGDLTQLATATLAAKYRSPLTIFLSATLALWTVTGIGVVVGHGARRFVDERLLQRTAAVVFAIAGIFLLVRH